MTLNGRKKWVTDLVRRAKGGADPTVDIAKILKGAPEGLLVQNERVQVVPPDFAVQGQADPVGERGQHGGIRAEDGE